MQKIRKSVNGVLKIIVIASGKGGVGKSTVAANVALALVRQNFSVGLLDADIYGPSMHTMFGIHTKAKFQGNNIIPEKKYGLAISSIGFLVDPGVAMIWRGPLITKMLYQLMNMTVWASQGESIDFLIVDTPPGTGDMHLSLAENYKVDGAIIVSTPQKLAISDAHKAVDMFGKLSIPIIGMVENMSYINLDGARHHIFGKNGVAKYCNDNQVKCIAQIPIYPEIVEASELGVSIFESTDEKSKNMQSYFQIIAQEVVNFAASR